MEKIFLIGKNNNLVTLALTPKDNPHEINKPVILLLNAGLVHRVGPFRFNVDIARILSKIGYFTARFDVSGIGDSAMPKSSGSYEKRIKDDVIEVMNFFQNSTGMNKFILVGLCSGAENAHAVASEDKRVSGIVMIDGFTYPTLLYYIIDLAPVFLNPLRLCKAIFKRIAKPFIRSKGKIDQSTIFVRTFPPRRKTAKELEEMAKRNVNILNIYSGEIDGYNYANQYYHMFKDVNFNKKMKLIYFKDADHTFSSISERNKMISSITGWLEENFTSYN